MHSAERLASIVAAAALLAPAAGVPAEAQVSSSPAALVIFPEILVDGVRGIDTVIQLGNAADGQSRCAASTRT